MHRFLVQTQPSFFALHVEHGHAVGESVAFGADDEGSVLL
jgi:hypothetical protein